MTIEIMAMIVAFFFVGGLLAIDEHYLRKIKLWSCAKCGEDLNEANGPVSILDGRPGHVCPKCDLKMQAYRSKFSLWLVLLACIAITAGCVVAILSNTNAGQPGAFGAGIETKMLFFMVVGVVAAPFGAGFCLYLMTKPMAVPRLEEKQTSQP